MRRKVMTVLGVLVMGAAVAGIPAGPASAENAYNGPLNVAFHSPDGRELTVCDGEDDGRSVWAGYYLVGSSSYYTATIDYPSNAEGVNCSYPYFFSSAMSNLRVVEDVPGTSNNSYGRWHGYPIAGN